MLTACSVIYCSDDSNQNNRIDSSWLSYYSRLITMKYSLREKCIYLKFFWSVFSHTQTECVEIWSISPHSI